MRTRNKEHMVFKIKQVEFLLEAISLKKKNRKKYLMYNL